MFHNGPRTCLPRSSKDRPRCAAAAATASGSAAASVGCCRRHALPLHAVQRDRSRGLSLALGGGRRLRLHGGRPLLWCLRRPPRHAPVLRPLLDDAATVGARVALFASADPRRVPAELRTLGAEPLVALPPRGGLRPRALRRAAASPLAQPQEPAGGRRGECLRGSSSRAVTVRAARGRLRGRAVGWAGARGRLSRTSSRHGHRRRSYRARVRAAAPPACRAGPRCCGDRP